MKEFLLLTSLILLQDGFHGTSEIKTQYITIPGTAVLSCQYEQNSTLRWLQRDSIISQGPQINPAVNGRERFRATNNLQDRQYELQISNTTEEDLGLYVCQAEFDSVITETKVILADGLHGAISEIKTQYITIPGTAVLSCPYEKNPPLRWLQRDSIISQGSTIHSDFIGRERFRVINKPVDRQYELQILNTTEEDLGLYVCEAQFDSVIIKTRVILKLADFIISTEENVMSTIFVDNDKSITFISEENSTTFVSDGISTGLSFREKFFYGLLAAGLALVLFLSVLCNFCLNRKCKKESSPITKESPTSPLQIMEENVPNDNQRISLVEMDEISVYESINENQMLSNLALAMQSNGRAVACQLKRSQSTSSTSSSEKLYSEIADDNAYLNPYQPMKSDRESSNLHKYSTTSNTDKSLQKPQCDDVDEVTIANQNTSSTLLEADVVNLSDHESSSDDDTDGIIDKGDGYLHPYVPLMTNCMEYLHSYSSPINHDQLMKNNKSLISSPCDDMDKVPIAEQKTKDSVGKENAMNLSDHESSKSDGDTDAM